MVCVCRSITGRAEGSSVSQEFETSTVAVAVVDASCVENEATVSPSTNVVPVHDISTTLTSTPTAGAGVVTDPSRRMPTVSESSRNRVAPGAST
ncbi:MAG: hypothetical protein ACKORL_12020 [Phycisphaerales bacterium]